WWSCLHSQPGVEFAGAIECGELVGTADMLAVDEDLRDRGAPAGAADHLYAPCRLLDDVDLGKGGALALQQRACARAIGAEHCRIHLDFSSHHQQYLERPKENYAPVRSARARVRTPTEVAPARFSTRAHSVTVAPVVNTSSTITTRLPATLRRA